MSSIHHKYADFSSLDAQSAPHEAKDEAFEDLKLQSFEEGYQAGWADAVKACESEEKSVTTELQQSLQDMSFTYVEALTKLSTALRPLLQNIVAKVLPQVVDRSLVHHLAEQIEDLTRNQIASEASLSLSQNGKKVVEKAIADAGLDHPLTLVVDPNLPDGQMRFKVGSAESMLDFDTLLKEISAAIDAHYSS